MRPPLNLVCFRHVAGDAFNRELLERLNASGRLYLTHTTLGGRFVLRLCVGQTNTDERHVADGVADDRSRGGRARARLVAGRRGDAPPRC